MRRPILPVAALILALAGGAAVAAAEKPAQPTQAKTPAKAAPKAPAAKPGAAGAERVKTEIKSVGVPAVKESVLTPEQVKAQQAEWKKLEEQRSAERKILKEKYKAVMEGFRKEGIKFLKGDKPQSYRVFAPAVAKITDPSQRKAAAKALATRLKDQMEPLFKKKITFDIYTDEKATQRVSF